MPKAEPLFYSHGYPITSKRTISNTALLSSDTTGNDLVDESIHAGLHPLLLPEYPLDVWPHPFDVLPLPPPPLGVVAATAIPEEGVYRLDVELSEFIFRGEGHILVVCRGALAIRNDYASGEGGLAGQAVHPRMRTEVDVLP